MKKFLILLGLLLITTPAFGAYTAPAKDTVVVVGGLGTMANKAQLNGGGATKAVWDAGSPSDFINTNGGPKRTASCAFTTATKNLNGTDIGNGVTVGTLCYVSTGDGSHITAGIYEITTVTDNDNIICLQIDDDGTNDTGVTVNVGGALDSLQNALDNGVNNGASYNRYIYDNIATETISATIDVNTYGGSSNTRVIVKGANSSCVVDGTRVIITTASDLTSGLVSFTNTVTYTQWWYIDFNAGGANKADYCIYNAADQSASYYHFFYDCIFRSALDESGVYIESDLWSLIGCQVYGNDCGVWTDGGNTGVISCSIHDNTTVGIEVSSAIRAYNNLIYDNGTYGLYLKDSGAINTVVFNNTIFGNGSHGVYVRTLADRGLILNNTSCGNGTGGSGYGYSIYDRGNTLFFAYNHSCDGLENANDNFDGHCNLMTDKTSDSEFASLFEGNNQTGDPNFTNINDGSENFTPTAGNLIDNALDAWNIGAEQDDARTILYDSTLYDATIY